jgi:spermidine synthase
MTTTAWTEEAWTDVTTRYRVESVLFESESEFQTIQVLNTHHYGRMLLLDGMVQTTEADEFIYHEMMAHVPLLSHPDPKRVLIIGGGDGGVLREVLRHPGVEKAVLVEIDEAVITLAREYFPTICADAFDHPRSEVVIEDGAEYLARSENQFDVVIIDSSDPIGPAEVLFTRDFYRAVAKSLRAGGIMTRQTGSTFMQPDELPQAVARARETFAQVHPYFFSVPTYVGGLFCGLLCSQTLDPLDAIEDQLEERLSKIEGDMQYYSPRLHLGALEVPGYVRKTLGDLATPKRDTVMDRDVTFGWELQIDLYECEQEAIATEDAIQRYARELCDVIEMKAYGEPLTPYFGENNDITKGYSLLQFIETSSITGHFSEGTDAAYINIFSCMPYDRDKAAAFTKEFFGAQRVVTRFVTRK